MHLFPHLRISSIEEKTKVGIFFMELKSETSYVRNIKCADVYTESTSDYSLPDYLGDVRKILFTEAALRPSGRFAGGDEVEFSGVILYNLIYLDSEGNISSAEFTSDYEYAVKCSGESYKDAVADTKISAYSIRLLGPRKFSARASLVGSARVSEESKIQLSGNALECCSTPEVSMGSAEVRACHISSGVEREMAEKLLELEGAIADEVSVVYSFAEPIADSVSAEGDSLTVKGRVRVNALVKTEDQATFGVDKVIPFEERLDFENAQSHSSFSPNLTVGSLKVSVNPTEKGCDLVADCIVEICTMAECNERVELVRDAYLKDAATENSYQDFRYHTLVDSATAKGVHNAELDRSALESEGLREIVLMTATPKVEKVELTDEGVNILGEIRYSGIASEIIDDKISYVSIKTNSPFATNVNTTCHNSENMQVEAKVLTHSASATLDENKIYFSTSLESCALILEEREEKILSGFSIKEGETDDVGEAKITVYYPTDGDTLFSVAKKYRTSVLKVARDNDIAESVFSSSNPDGKLSGVKKLIIY